LFFQKIQILFRKIVTTWWAALVSQILKSTLIQAVYV
jgi:hypothetical protein